MPARGPPGKPTHHLHSRKPQASTPNAMVTLKDPSPPSQPGMSRGRPKVKCICLWVHTHLPLSSFVTQWPHVQTASAQSKAHDRKGECGRKIQRTRRATAYILLFYLNCLSLSRTVSQKNSIFITKQVSYARVKTAALLLWPLLFLRGHLRWYVYVR